MTSIMRMYNAGVLKTSQHHCFSQSVSSRSVSETSRIVRISSALDRLLQGMDDSRVTLTGTVEVLSGAEEKAARELYRQRHPDSFWIDFGDFEPFRMTSISKVRLNGGFARAATVSALLLSISTTHESRMACQPDGCLRSSQKCMPDERACKCQHRLHHAPPWLYINSGFLL